MNATKVHAFVANALDASGTQGYWPFFDAWQSKQWKKLHVSMVMQRGDVDFQGEHLAAMNEGRQEPPDTVVVIIRGKKAKHPVMLARYAAEGDTVYVLREVSMLLPSYWMSIARDGKEGWSVVVATHDKSKLAMHPLNGCSHFLLEFKENAGPTEKDMSLLRSLYACFICEVFAEDPLDVLKERYPATFETM